MNTQSIFSTITAALVLPVALFAQSAYEGFDFSDTNIAGSGSGTGWTGNWSVASGTWATAAGSLEVGDLETTGNRVVSGTNGANIAARQFSGAPSSGEFWASIVVSSSNLGGGLTFSNNDTENLNLTGGGFTDRPRFGFGVNGSDFIYSLDGREGSPVNGSVAGATNASTLLVAKFDVTNGLFSLWANPTIGGASPTGGTLIADDVAFTRSGATFAGDVTYAGLSANWGGIALDEVRLGTSFNEVTPIPEPSSYGAALSVLVVAITCLVRRRNNRV